MCLSNPEFWELVAFVLAVGLVWKKASVVIGGHLDQRAARIKDEIDEARNLRDEAQSLLAEYQRKQADALSEAQAIKAHAEAEAVRLGEKASADLDAALIRREQQAEEKIAQAETRAIKEVREQVVDLAIAAARRLIADDLSPGRASALIDEGIAALPKSLH